MARPERARLNLYVFTTPFQGVPPEADPRGCSFLDPISSAAATTALSRTAPISRGSDGLSQGGCKFSSHQPTSRHSPSLNPSPRNMATLVKPRDSCRPTLAGFGSVIPAYI